MQEVRQTNLDSVKLTTSWLTLHIKYCSKQSESDSKYLPSCVADWSRTWLGPKYTGLKCAGQNLTVLLNSYLGILLSRSMKSGRNQILVSKADKAYLR